MHNKKEREGKKGMKELRYEEIGELRYEEIEKRARRGCKKAKRIIKFKLVKEEVNMREIKEIWGRVE